MAESGRRRDDDEISDRFEPTYRRNIRMASSAIKFVTDSFPNDDDAEWENDVVLSLILLLLFPSE